MQAIKRSDYYS